MEVIAILVLGLVSRLLVVWNANTRFDTYGHLYFIKELKRQKTGPYGSIIARVVGARRYSQPFFWHWLLGQCLSENIIVNHHKWINPVIDVLFAVGCYYLTLYSGHGESASMQVAALYLMTPIWFSRLATGPRINSFTPRLISEVGVNLFFITTILSFGLPFWLELLIGACLSSLVLLASKFGLQALLFLTPLISLTIFDPAPVLSLLLGFGVCILLSRGQYVNAVKEQLTHLIWYFNKNIKGEMAVSDRNKISDLFSDISSVKDALKAIVKLVTRNSFVSVLVKMPVLVGVGGLLICAYLDGVNISTYAVYLWPVIVGFSVFCLINIPVALFLGEAERYINHISFFVVSSAVLLSHQLQMEVVIWALMIYGLLFLLLESFVLHLFEPQYVKEKIETDIISDLKASDKELVVLCYPYHAVGVFRVMLETEHKTVFVFMTEPEFSERFNEKYAGAYPYVKLESLPEMSEQLGVNYLVIERKQLGKNGYSSDWNPGPGWSKQSITTGIYDVYVKSGC